jgi:hypothetical protein
MQAFQAYSLGLKTSQIARIRLGVSLDIAREMTKMAVV